MHAKGENACLWEVKETNFCVDPYSSDHNVRRWPYSTWCSQQVTALIRLQASYRAYILFLLQKNNRKAGLVHFMHFGRPYSISCGLLLSLCVCLSVGHDRKPFKNG